jgi:hypothetical protein
MLLDITIGRKGLLGYLKALAGSNVIRIMPASVSASEAQANGHKRLRVTCGANTSYLADGDFIKDKTPVTFCEARICPNNAVKPNIGAIELAEALNSRNQCIRDGSGFQGNSATAGEDFRDGQSGYAPGSGRISQRDNEAGTHQIFRETAL